MTAAMLLATAAAPAWAEGPKDELQTTIERVIAILRNPSLKSPARATERYAAIRSAIEPIFDFSGAARQALGPHWRGLTAGERTKFVGLFTDLLERSYISKIESYGGEHVRYGGASIDGDYATVRTQIMTPRDTEIPVDYRMRQRGGRWLVYDVSIEGVSLIENYRAQFNTIIDTSSYAELVKKIESRLAQLAAR